MIELSIRVEFAHVRFLSIGQLDMAMYQAAPTFLQLHLESPDQNYQLSPSSTDSVSNDTHFYIYTSIHKLTTGTRDKLPHNL